MRVSRLFVAAPLSVGQPLVLEADAGHYVGRVLRLRVGDPLTLFNGQGGEYQARLAELSKKQVALDILTHAALERESPLALTLVQGISRNEHMDWVMQKAVELGVQRIAPVITERTQGFQAQQLEKRQIHWEKIIQHACEQCGRNRLPLLLEAQPLLAHLASQTGTGLLLDPLAEQGMPQTAPTGFNGHLLIGAEGGLSAAEIAAAQQAGYLGVRLGTRILRTETAALAIVTLCQARWGDLG